MINVKNDYIRILTTQIRDIKSTKEELREGLYLLGYELGKIICIEKLSVTVDITTPMGLAYNGSKIISEFENVVISTKDDYSYFARGVAKALRDPLMGYMDFNGARGEDALTAPIRSIVLPDISTGKSVGYIVIAKAVIATGCTAISLAKKAYEKYMPKGIIITSAFYSRRGMSELQRELPNATIYVLTQPDEINEHGMLVPGIGNIDSRISS